MAVSVLRSSSERHRFCCFFIYVAVLLQTQIVICGLRSSMISDVGDELMTDVVEKQLKRFGVTVSKPVLAIVSIIFGLLVIAFPDLLVWIVGLFFIIMGILTLVDYFELRRK